MRTKNPLALLFGWIAVALAPAPESRAAESGGVAAPVATMSSLSGRVSNAATKSNLEGAVVRLEGTPYLARTERDGSYHLQVPPGNYTVAASYTGLDAQAVPLVLGPSAALVRDFELTAEIYKMGAFTVAGEREGNALALTMQRQADGVKNVVSTDALGTLAGNPAELVARLPGVSGEAVGGDIRYVRIRGMDHRLSSVTMDGNRMADSAGAATNREFMWQQAGSDSIERIEVTKSPTPDLDADSIGGSVNLVSKSAFDRSPERRIGFSVGAISHFTDRRDFLHRNLSGSYSEVFGGKLGVAINYGHRAHNNLYDGVTGFNWQNTVSDPAYVYDITLTDQGLVRTRWGGGIKLDYKLSDHTRFFVNASMNKHSEFATVDTTRWFTAQTVATRAANGTLTGTGAIIPEYTSKVTEWRNINNSGVTVGAQTHRNQGDGRQYRIGAVHAFEGLKIDYDAFQSTSKFVYFKNATFSITARSIGMRIETKDEPFFPNISQISGPDMTNINNYAENQLATNHRIGHDKYQGAAVNAKRDFRTVAPTYLKAGLRWRKQERDADDNRQRWEFAGPDGVIRSGDENLAQFLNPNHRESIRDGKYPRMPFTTRPFSDKLGNARDYTGYNVWNKLQDAPNQFVEDVAYNVMTPLVGRQLFSEEIKAAYVMGNVDLGRLSILGGLRVEETKTWGEGSLNEITSAEKARRAAWVGTVTPAELARRTAAQYAGRQQASGQYREVFPGVHFKLEPFSGLITRASYATNIGRPNIAQIIPNTTVNDDARTVSTSNQSLRPQYGDNFDVSVEYYFEPVGVLSAGVFLKEIKQFIYTLGGQTVGTGPDNGFNGDYAGYTLTSQANGGFAKVKGFELAYQQQFTFLPGWWNGFGIYANYSRLETKGDYGEGPVTSTDQVAGFTPESANFGISYIRRPVSIRLQFNHVGQYLNSYNASQARLLYRLARSVVDLKTVYTISRHYEAYFDVTNLLNEADRAQVWYGGRPNFTQKHSPQFYLGINGRY